MGSTVLSIYVTDEFKAKITEEARKAGLSRSKYMELALDKIMSENILLMRDIQRTVKEIKSSLLKEEI